MLSPPFIIYYMGCCNDCLTCDIAFNAVMPLSRASTRGSYSRIEGVTPLYIKSISNSRAKRRARDVSARSSGGGKVARAGKGGSSRAIFGAPLPARL